MVIRNHITAAAVLATLTGCAMAPAHADAPGRKLPAPSARIERLPPGDLLGYKPATVPAIPGGASVDRLFDAPATGNGPIASPVLLASWRGAPSGWNPPGLDGPGLGSGSGGNNNGNNQQNGGNGNGNQGCGNGNGGPSGGKDCGGKPPNRLVPGVPGPMPLLGAAAAFGWARRLRGRAGR